MGQLCAVCCVTVCPISLICEDYFLKCDLNSDLTDVPFFLIFYLSLMLLSLISF